MRLVPVSCFVILASSVVYVLYVVVYVYYVLCVLAVYL